MVLEAGSLRSERLPDQVLMRTLPGLWIALILLCPPVPGGRASESQLSGVPSRKASDPIRPEGSPPMSWSSPDPLPKAPS